MYVVTGASGHLGRLVIQHLLEYVPPEQIIATTRHPQKLTELAQAGIMVRLADFTDPSTLPAAFEGATRLLIISTDNMSGKRVDHHKAAIAAAVASNVNHLVYTSIVDADSNSANFIAREHGITEAALAASGIEWTSLRNNYYAEVLPSILRTLLSRDRLFIPEGKARSSWVTREDCARTAASVLAGHTSLAGALDITGPEALGFADLAERLSNVLGRTITTQTLADEELRAYIATTGLSEQAKKFTFGMATALARAGYENVADTVERATGTKATEIEVVLRSLDNA